MKEARPPARPESRLETAIYASAKKAIYASAKKLRALVVEQGMSGQPIPDVAGARTTSGIRAHPRHFLTRCRHRLSQEGRPLDMSKSARLKASVAQNAACSCC